MTLYPEKMKALKCSDYTAARQVPQTLQEQ